MRRRQLLLFSLGYENSSCVCDEDEFKPTRDKPEGSAKSSVWRSLFCEKTECIFVESFFKISELDCREEPACPIHKGHTT